jgi:hypothetical protein
MNADRGCVQVALLEGQDPALPDSGSRTAARRYSLTEHTAVISVASQVQSPQPLISQVPVPPQEALQPPPEQLTVTVPLPLEVTVQLPPAQSRVTSPSLLLLTLQPPLSHSKLETPVPLAVYLQSPSGQVHSHTPALSQAQLSSLELHTCEQALPRLATTIMPIRTHDFFDIMLSSDAAPSSSSSRGCRVRSSSWRAGRSTRVAAQRVARSARL